MLSALLLGRTIMVRPAVGVVLALTAAVALCGCGTMRNMRGSDDGSSSTGIDALPPESVYGGVRMRAQQAWTLTFSPLTEKDVPFGLGMAAGVASVPVTLLVLADMPFCAVADTLTLPWTVNAEWTRLMKPADKPSLSGKEETKTSSPPAEQKKDEG
jgi:uncharacterized protein YceK